jgi:CheY-like chemotaxis protein
MKRSDAPKKGRGPSTTPPCPVTVLHVDDDLNDTELLQAACQKGGVGFKLVNVEDGEKAMAYLSCLDSTSTQPAIPRPALVLLDLKMPRTTGFEILHWIRNHPTLHRLPVIVLSGSELQEDIRKAYAQGANSYLVKPLGFEALVKMVKNLSAVWVTSGFEMLGR